MKFKNHHSDARDFDALGLVNIAPGQTFEATGPNAESLLAQGYPRVDKPQTRSTDNSEGGES